MTLIDYNAPAELLLGTTEQTALASGPRSFRTAALALRFAFEQAAPVSLRGAKLSIGEQNYCSDALRALYLSPDYPLERPRKIELRNKRRLPFYGARYAHAA